MDNLFLASLNRIFSQHFTPATLRMIEAGGTTQAAWAALEGSGFLDVLLPEEAGGAALTLADAFPLFLSAGYHAVPLPYVQTTLARAWLHAAGMKAPAGAMAIAGLETQQSGDRLIARSVSFGRVADWLLTDMDGQWALLPVTAAQQIDEPAHDSLLATLQWEQIPHEAMIIHIATENNTAPASLATLSAACHASLLAGAAAHVLDMTLEYASQRAQFGKHIGRFQAIQSQISIMAERVYASRMAAQIACQSHGCFPNDILAAIGKSRSSEAACIVADIGHAVHGAIGITQEYDLQLYTRRLRAWRRAAGTEHFWNMQIGAKLLQTPEQSALSFICATLADH